MIYTSFLLYVDHSSELLHAFGSLFCFWGSFCFNFRTHRFTFNSSVLHSPETNTLILTRRKLYSPVYRSQYLAKHLTSCSWANLTLFISVFACFLSRRRKIWESVHRLYSIQEFCGCLFHSALLLSQNVPNRPLTGSKLSHVISLFPLLSKHMQPSCQSPRIIIMQSKFS